MISRPRVSVVIPFYNTPPPFLREAIESVLAQAYGEWELLLVDDGSASKSVEIARSYASTYGPKVLYLEHPGHENRGISASRNLGIARARGEYVAFLDADDVWLPHKLEEQVALMDAHPQAAMLYGNTLYWHSWSTDSKDSERDYVPDLGVATGSLVPPPRLLPLFLRGRAAVPPPCSILGRLEIVRRLGGFVGWARGLYEDQMFYAKVCLDAPVFVAGACWDLYRQHSGGLSQSASRIEERTGRQVFLDWLEAYLSESGVEERQVWRALRQERWRVRHPVPARLLRMPGRLVQRIKRASA